MDLKALDHFTQNFQLPLRVAQSSPRQLCVFHLKPWEWCASVNTLRFNPLPKMGLKPKPFRLGQNALATDLCRIKKWQLRFSMKMIMKMIMKEPFDARVILCRLKNGSITASFYLLSSFSHYNFNNTNWNKPGWCAWDSNLWPQVGRRRQNHKAMAAAHSSADLQRRKWIKCPNNRSWSYSEI